MTRFIMPLSLVWLFLTLQAATITRADGNKRDDDLQYFAVDVGELVQGFNASHIVSDPPVLQGSFYQMLTRPRVVVPSGADAFLSTPEQANNEYRGYRIVGAKEPGQEIAGRIYMLRRHPDEPSESVLAAFDFKVEGEPLASCTREEFLRAQGNEFLDHWNENMAGAAMFRHLARQSLSEIGVEAAMTGARWQDRQIRGLEATIRLTSGGQAVSENLQLDRELAASVVGDEPLEDLANVNGITVAEIDWKPLLQDVGSTELDPLASLIPQDQYAVFLPDFDSLLRLIDQGDVLSKPLTQWAEPASRRTDVLGFYQQQLGLPLNFVTRQLGGRMIGSVALTGSDPYFRTGTDLALVLGGPQPALLREALVAQVSALADAHKDAVASVQRIGKFKVQTWRTNDRRLCCHVALTDRAVIVSNSIVQLQKILGVAADDVPSMNVLDEYRFFRQRYLRGEDDEAALVVITDAAIRKWCGPQWRISASRRTIARASLAEYTMQNADALIMGTITEPVMIRADDSLPEAGKLILTRRGVTSESFGTMQFQTPIAEMNLQKATKREIDLYTNWRNAYQRRWRRVFDPIAVRLAIDSDELAVDLTVIPLILDSDYRFWRRLVGDRKLPARMISPPDSLLSLDTALDLDSDTVQMIRPMLGNQLPFDPLGWIDESVGVYFMPDQPWLERVMASGMFGTDGEDLFFDLPIAIHFPSKNNFQMTAFTVGFRGMLEQISPNMFDWKSVDYRGMTYVIGTVREGLPVGNSSSRPRLCYVTTSEGWTLSLNPRVIEAAIDRAMDAKTPKLTEPEGDPPQLRLHAMGSGIEILSRSSYQTGVGRMSRLSWSNLPILNYFRHRYPEQDPLRVYQKLFGQSLTEPSGGEYVWSDHFQGYESTLYGHHLHPKAGPAISPVLDPGDQIDTTLSFQDGGLRATLNWRGAAE